MSDMVIFAGPSIAQSCIRSHCASAQLRSPVQLGDLCQYTAKVPATIVILDGYFSQVPAVWHKEIMLLLNLGCRVIGAASMGALRAAELTEQGMEGVGWVYEQYRSGCLQDDDEVALLHTDAELGYQPLSFALVNLRFLLTTDLLSKTQHAILGWLIQALKAEFYPRRTLERCQQLLQTQQIDQQQSSELLRLLQQPQRQIKYQDAVRAMQRAQQEKPCSEQIQPPEQTVFLQRLLQQTCARGSDHCSQLAKLLSLWPLASDELPVVTAAQIQQQFCQWSKQKGFRDNSAVLQWLQQHGLQVRDMQRLMQLLARLSMADDTDLSSAFHLLLQEIPL